MDVVLYIDIYACMSRSKKKKNSKDWRLQGFPATGLVLYAVICMKAQVQQLLVNLARRGFCFKT